MKAMFLFAVFYYAISLVAAKPSLADTEKLENLMDRNVDINQDDLSNLMTGLMQERELSLVESLSNIDERQNSETCTPDWCPKFQTSADSQKDKETALKIAKFVAGKVLTAAYVTKSFISTPAARNEWAYVFAVIDFLRNIEEDEKCVGNILGNFPAISSSSQNPKAKCTALLSLKNVSAIPINKDCNVKKLMMAIDVDFDQKFKMQLNCFMHYIYTNILTSTASTDEDLKTIWAFGYDISLVQGILVAHGKERENKIKACINMQKLASADPGAAASAGKRGNEEELLLNKLKQLLEVLEKTE